MRKRIYPAPFFKKRDGAKKNKKRGGVYLDYASTTPVDPKVLKAMKPYLKEEFANPSSIHSSGQKARTAIDKAREAVAEFLHCQPGEVVFTGSATEADNLAILGQAYHFLLKNRKFHIVTSQIEHPAVWQPCEALEKWGVKVTYLPVNKKGEVKVSDLKKAVQKNTVLVSIMYANSEIGTIQPIREIAKFLKTLKQKVYFHTDAVQAVNYLDCSVKKLGVDLLTLSGHKIYGPKGIGALYIKQGTPVSPLIFGGGHEQGFRSGTENVAGIVGLAAALKEVKKSKSKIRKTRKLRDKLIEGVLKSIPKAKLNGSRSNRLANNANFTIKGAEGESQVLALDQKGIAATTGSACSSGSLKASRTLLALGLSKTEAHCSLRLSLGRYTTQEEINKVLKVLPPIIKRLRKVSGYL